MKSVVLIPAYKPGEKFVVFLHELFKLNHKVVVVNDGSGEEYDRYFETASRLGAVVLVHEENKGKGRALKTGLKYVLDNMPDVDFVVTADCDGQHTPQDIQKVIDSGSANPNTIILGGRFSGKGDKVPRRSVLGNTVTRWVFRLATGLPIKDTQTGLRGLPRFLIPKLVELKGERFEYEMNMLLYLKEWSVPFLEIPISTIYYDNNAGSHFNTFRDAWRIFKQIVSFLLVAILSLIIDYALFKVFSLLGIWIPLCYVFARIISSIFNFAMNARFVFKNQDKKVILKYYLVAFFIMIAGAGGTNLFASLGIPEILSKIMIDLPLFFASYILQREFVFKKKMF
jgi:glycosyltransferase involved in cell wall biosynthesis